MHNEWKEKTHKYPKLHTYCHLFISLPRMNNVANVVLCLAYNWHVPRIVFEAFSKQIFLAPSREQQRVHLKLPAGHTDTNLLLPIFTGRRAFQFQFDAEIRMKIQLFVDCQVEASFKDSFLFLSSPGNHLFIKKHFHQKHSLRFKAPWTVHSRWRKRRKEKSLKVEKLIK